MTPDETDPDLTEAIRRILDRTAAAALRDFEMGTLIRETAASLRAVGFPLSRLHMTMRVLHPVYTGMATTWRAGGESADYTFVPADDEADDYLRSPVAHLIDNRLPELLLSTADPALRARFPLLDDLAAEGATAYFLVLTLFGDPETALDRRDGFVMSWVTDAPGGWTPAQLDVIRRLQSRLALIVRLAVTREVAKNVAATFLGVDPGRRVLAGHIRRGDGEDIEAVVWFSDLRASTRLAEQLGLHRFLQVLNRFFDCTAGAVDAAGGDVLRFVGDSVLAIFRYDRFGGAENACAAALAAARDAAARIDALNRARAAEAAEPLGFGVGLHPGVVTFGNIGVPTRLEFTVVGPTANTAARVADKCRTVGERIVASAAFADLAGGAWRSLGRFELRNVGDPVELKAPA